MATATVNKSMKIGDKVTVRFTGENQVHPAKIVKENADGCVEVIFEPPIVMGMHHVYDGCVSRKEIITMDNTPDEITYDEDRLDDHELGIVRVHHKRLFKMFVTGEINEEFLAKFWRQIEAAKNTEYDVEIYLNTPGGQDYIYVACIDLVNALLQVKPMTTCTALGMVASAGVPIFLSFGKGCRFVYPHSVLMIHDGETTGAANSLNEAKANYKEVVTLHKIYTSFISTRSGIPLKTVIKLCKNESRFMGQECIEAGFACGLKKER